MVIEKSDENLMDTKFGKGISKWIETTDDKIAKCEENMKKVQKDYAEINDKLMLDKKDEMRTKSEKFMQFFADYFNEVHKVMPKLEDPKKDKKKGPRHRTVAAVNMVAELQKKQAMMNK